jgi:hypothetical protein
MASKSGCAVERTAPTAPCLLVLRFELSFLNLSLSYTHHTREAEAAAATGAGVKTCDAAGAGTRHHRRARFQTLCLHPLHLLRLHPSLNAKPLQPRIPAPSCHLRQVRKQTSRGHSFHGLPATCMRATPAQQPVRQPTGLGRAGCETRARTRAAGRAAGRAARAPAISSKACACAAAKQSAPAQARPSQGLRLGLGTRGSAQSRWRL